MTPSGADAMTIYWTALWESHSEGRIGPSPRFAVLRDSSDRTRSPQWALFLYTPGGMKRVSVHSSREQAMVAAESEVPDLEHLAAACEGPAE